MGHGVTSRRNQVASTDALGHTTGYVYDVLNRRIETVFADGTSEHTEYDALGRRTAKIDQAAVRTQYAYDALGRLTGVTDAIGGVTTYAYDEMGNQITQTDALGRVTRFDYDTMGRRTRRTLPLGAAESMTYDLAGNLSAKTDFMGRTTTFGYDIVNRLKNKTFTDGSGFAFTYTSTGRRATATDSRGTTAYAYDVRDRLLTMTYPDGRKLGYTYDARGNRKSLTATIGATSLASSYSYNAVGQLTGVTDPNGASYGYTYDPTGARSSLAQPNGTVTTYTYDALGHLKTLVTSHQPSSTTIQSYTYTLGPTGIRNRIDELGGVSRSYGYDGLYRLTSETVTGSANDYTKTFAYDAVGNRLNQSTVGYNAANVNYTYDNRDRLLTENSTNYGWDENGNLTSKSGDSQYTWDFEDHLIRVTKTDGTIVEHTYDVDGVRVQTTITPAGGGAAQVTNYLVDTAGALSHVVAETDSTGAITVYYVRGGDQLLAEIRGSDVRYYHADGLGSVRALTDANGAVTDGYGYTAFGEALGWSGGDVQPYRFAGEEWEGVSALSYARTRWYLFTIGRFAAEDRYPGTGEEPISLNRYVYVSDEPVRNVDPNGYFGLDAVLATTLHGIAPQSPLARAGTILKRDAGTLEIGSHSDSAISSFPPGSSLFTGGVLQTALLGVGNGHSWLAYIEGGQKTIYDTWGPGTRSPVGLHQTLDQSATQGQNAATRLIHLRKDERALLFQYVKEVEAEGTGAWRYLAPCSRFAAVGWRRVTHEYLDDTSIFGISNPASLRSAIIAANRGSSIGWLR